jgi:hypothetical protein
LKLPEDEESSSAGANEADTKKEEDVPAGGTEDGLDSQWNRRMKERLEAMKSKKMRDMSITVTQKSGLSGALASRQRKIFNNKDGETATTTTGQGRVREELVDRKGQIQFLTGEEDGTVEICVQSILASIKNPSRLSIKVSMAVVGGKEEEEGQTTAKKSDGLDTSEISSKMSRLERDLQTLQNRVKACLNNADFNKDQEAAFHEQSVSMNRAATYWPMIQLMVLLVTGFTQANHIVRYLKTHHIGI